MINFTFKISNVKKRPAGPSNFIIETKCEGIVIFEADVLYVMYNFKKYNITLDSYRCKGKKIVYYRNSITGKYTKIIRDNTNRPNMPKMYIPFKDKLKVKGCIIRNNDKDKFKIVSSYNPASQDEINEALLDMKKFEEIANE